MAITITEKQHWKERIGSKIDKRIEKLKLSDPAFFRDIKEQAKKEAISHFSLTDEFRRIDEILQSEKSLRQEREGLYSIILERLTGDGKYYSDYNTTSCIDRELSKVESEYEERLLQNHKLGREIAKLNAEKENLLDTVWIATSPRQVTELWQKVVTLLGGESTEMQREVIAGKTRKA